MSSTLEEINGHPLNVDSDFPDSRDWIYRPSLLQLEDNIDNSSDSEVLNQLSEGACTGFAVAASINLQRRLKNPQAELVSSRMLYQMAQKHDEWAGADYSGSSLRGAIHGWKNMGVCLESEWPYTGSDNDLTLNRARAAKKNTIGAYYRLRPVISDYHAALQEVGVIVCSAKVHPGWQDATDGVITPSTRLKGGHAFAIVGYCQKEKGFLIQNSWGAGWGTKGFAIWKYTDWINTVMDAWVFRIALDTSDIFDAKPKYSKLYAPALIQQEKQRSPLREEIAGHFVHIDNGEFAEKGRYWSNENDIDQIIAAIKNTDKTFRGKNGYQNIVIYAHGGLNTPKDSARRIKALKEVYKNNGVYPIHLMYDTGLTKELIDVLRYKGEDSLDRTGNAIDLLDKVVERLVKKPGMLIWEEIKNGAQGAFIPNGAANLKSPGQILIQKLEKSVTGKHGAKLHFVGHSTGAIVFGHLLNAFASQKIQFETVSLMAPATNYDLFAQAYSPVIKEETKLKINDLKIYNLRDSLEQEDCVVSEMIYRKSLLYLVSNALERKGCETKDWECKKPLLGMENFEADFNRLAGKELNIAYSNGATSRATRSLTHGGFDNDPTTMNDILKRITGSKPKKENQFNEQHLTF